VNNRVKSLALAQSADVRARLEREGIRIILGTARFTGETAASAHVVEAVTAEGTEELAADVVLIATGATPRVLDDARPDGERILTWRQLYDLQELPEHLIVIGSGVTGAEFCSAYVEMGSEVTLISSRDRVMPGEDADASAVLQDVFVERGVNMIAQARAQSVKRTDDGVAVTLADGRVITGSHALMTVGSVPNTADLGLGKVGIETDRGGFVPVDRVSRTNISGIYAAGDCTGVLMLASVAAMQGRIAMWHALGEGVSPIKLKTVAAAVFTRPEIATVGISQRAIDSGEVPARTIMLPLATNPRAKMQGLRRGFVKLFCRPATGVIIGGVIVAPVASELILPIAMAVQNGLSVEDLAHTFSVYPSLSGSITEAGRQLMRHGDLD
jgi:pyruvate/2-oxoglutarate dehydrogenase complex dihydrolipoamide dehydrogenase (E3) component